MEGLGNKASLGLTNQNTVNEDAKLYTYIAGVKKEYTFKHTDEVDYNDHPYVVEYLGLGVDSINPDEDLMHYYLETDKINIKKENNMNTNTKPLVIDENTPINDETIEEVLKQSPDSVDRLNVLINYSKLSLGSLLEKDPSAADAEAIKIHDKISSILRMMIDNKMLSDEDKKKFEKAMNEEIAEYEKIMDAFEAVTDETVTEAKTTSSATSSSSSDSDWIMWLIGGLIVGAAGYAIYRYLNPNDVVLDMSTMNIMSR